MHRKQEEIHMNYDNEPRQDILCIDVKSFFASVEAVERNLNPLDARICVVSRPNRQGGLVLASSPLVKAEYGVKTGTRVFDIPQEADIQIVEPRMALYLKKNLEILNIFRQFVSDQDLHPYSIDESFLNVSHSHRLFGTTYQIARTLQDKIWQEMGLVVTVGIGDNPLLAKLALDHQAKKKAISHYIAHWRYQDVPHTVWKIEDLADFWGIGSRTKAKLNKLGIETVYDLAQADLAKLKDRFGIIGQQLFFHAHGIDRTQLSDHYTPQSSSYSRNQILQKDYTDPYEIKVVIREMGEENAMRLRKYQQTAGLVKLTIGYSRDILAAGFSHQVTIEATDSSKKLQDYLVNIFDQYYDYQPVRVVNVTFGQIAPKQGVQLSLFEDNQDQVREEKKMAVIDHIKSRFGNTAILPANSLLDGSMAIYRDSLVGGHRAGDNPKKTESEGH